MPKKRTLHPKARPHMFRPGVSGNPNGRPIGTVNPIQKALKNLTIESYRECIEAVCTGNLANLKAMVDDPKISALQVGIARAFIKAMQAGDYAVIERIAERIVGKIPDELKVSSQNVNANLNASIDKEKLKAALEHLDKDV